METATKVEMLSANAERAKVSAPHSSESQETEKILKEEVASARLNGSMSKPADNTEKGSTSTEPRIKQDPYLGKYKFIRTIGKGNFAKVKLAKHVITGREVAIKIIDKTQLNPSSLTKLFREVRIMKMLDHPNIVKLYEVIENEKILYLVMEYANGGEVFDYLVAHGRMKEKEARAKFRQIASAVQYCHAKHVVHRDLKAENLLLDSELNIKLADFGFANEFRQGNKLDTFCGSPPYAAPELFQGRKYDGPEVDVWSLGVILYTLVSGSLPFDGTTLRELRERVLRGKYRIPYYMSSECENLLKKMLITTPSKRFTLNQILVDKWVNIGYESDVLQPYVDTGRDLKDPVRIEILMKMGFTREEVEMSLNSDRFDNITATYHLLGERGTLRITSNGSSCTSSVSTTNVTNPPRASTSQTAASNPPQSSQLTNKKSDKENVKDGLDKTQKVRNINSIEASQQHDVTDKRPTRSHSTERTDSESWKQNPSMPMKANDPLRASERPGRNEAVRIIERLRHTFDSNVPAAGASGAHTQDANLAHIADGYSLRKPIHGATGGQNTQPPGFYSRVPSPNVPPNAIPISNKRPQVSVYPNSAVAGIGGVLPLTPTMPPTAPHITSHGNKGGSESHGARSSASSGTPGGRAGTLPAHSYSTSGGRTMPNTDARNRPHSSIQPSSSKSKHGSVTPTPGTTKDSAHTPPSFFKEFGHFSFRHSKSSHVSLPPSQNQASQDGSPTFSRHLKSSSTTQSLSAQVGEKESSGTDANTPTPFPSTCVSASPTEPAKANSSADNPTANSGAYETGVSFLRSLTAKLLLKRHSGSQRGRQSELSGVSKSPTLHEEPSTNDNSSIATKTVGDEPTADVGINPPVSTPSPSPAIVISPVVGGGEESTITPAPRIHKNNSDPDFTTKNGSNAHASSGQHLPNVHLTPAPLNKTQSTSGNAVLGSTPTKPRILRFTLNMKTTSTLDAAQMMPEIENVLKGNNIEYTQREPFLLVCQHGEASPPSTVENHDGDAQAAPAVNMQVRFEIEVCRLPLLSVNGVRFKRISGASIVYKNIAGKISSELKFPR